MDGQFAWADDPNGKRFYIDAEGKRRMASYWFDFGEGKHYRSASAAEHGLFGRSSGSKYAWRRITLVARGVPLADVLEQGFENPGGECPYPAGKTKATRPRGKRHASGASSMQCTISVRSARQRFTLTDVARAIASIEDPKGRLTEKVKLYFTQLLDHGLRDLASSRRRLALELSGREIRVNSDGRCEPVTPD